MKIEDVQAIYKEFHVPVHIQRHMQKVSEVAMKIAEAFKENGIKLNKEALKHAALLHDAFKIGKIKSYNDDFFKHQVSPEDRRVWQELKKSCEGIDDSQAMCNFLLKKGEKEVAEIIKKHDFKSLLNEEIRPQTWEEKILYYADKRVKHDEIVPLTERLRDGRERYITTKAQLEQAKIVEEAVFELEKEIFAQTNLGPEDIF